MIRKANEMAVTECLNKLGGNGSVIQKEIVPKDMLIHGRFFNLMTLKKGCSIGQHTHHSEVEFYYVLSGEGIVTESDGEKKVCAGDVVITGDGQTHAIRNDGDEDLVFTAYVATEA